MAVDDMPSDLVRNGGTPTFTEETIPDALQKEHRLAEGTWGVLHVSDGSIRFVDLKTSQENVISAPGQVKIQPGAPHRVAIVGPVEFRIDFFREPRDETGDGATG